MELTNNNIIEESENWNSGLSKGASYKEIVLNQLQRAVSNMSQEMREGFWIYSHVSNQSPQKIRYIGDSRDETKSSLDVLHDLLMPKFDNDMRGKSKEIYEKFENFHQEYVKAPKSERGNYWNPVLKIYRELFQELCLFLEKIGWLETDSLEN